MKTTITIIRSISYLCVLATIILAVVWFIADVNRIEPITVGLGALSVLLFGVASLLQYRYDKSASIQPVDMSQEELLSIVAASDPISDWDVSFSGPQALAVYKEYTNLRIEHEHSSNYLHSDDFHEKWANKFPDSHASSYYYDLYFGPTRLRRILLVHVDGGRASLPMPQSAVDLRVDKISLNVARIFDNLGTLDDYFSRSGLELVDSQSNKAPA